MSSDSVEEIDQTNTIQPVAVGHNLPLPQVLRIISPSHGIGSAIIVKSFELLPYAFKLNLELLGHHFIALGGATAGIADACCSFADLPEEDQQRF